MSNENRGEVNRAAIADSMTHSNAEEESTFDETAFLSELSDIKQLKADNLEDPEDKELADELEKRSEALKIQIEEMAKNNPNKAKELVVKGYKSTGFDQVDLIELGFDNDTAVGFFN